MRFKCGCVFDEPTPHVCPRRTRTSPEDEARLRAFMSEHWLTDREHAKALMAIEAFRPIQSPDSLEST